MKKISIVFLYIFVIICTTSCTSLKEAGEVLKNEKRKTTDEFLVKKRGPLTEPPDYKSIPEPGSLSSNKKENENDVEKLLKISNKNKVNRKSSSSAEELILNEIRK